jgi:hypothetical protein
LEAYLQSLRRYFPSGLIQTHILHKAELFEEEYQQIFRSYASCVVTEENDFFSDFLSLLQRIDTKYILLGVDDVVYFDCVDIDVVDECFTKFADDIFGFTLRFSTEVTKEGGDRICESLVAGQTVYSLNWAQGRTPTTRYPFELCATIYPTVLIKKIIGSVPTQNPVIRSLFSPRSFLIRALGKVISTRRILKSFGYFFNPNTLESWSCRWCQNHSERLPRFLYFQKQCASAIQVNMVNTSTANETDGSAEYTVEALADKYRQGYGLDIDFVAECKPAGTHCGSEYFRLKRN